MRATEHLLMSHCHRIVNIFWCHCGNATSTEVCWDVWSKQERKHCRSDVKYFGKYWICYRLTLKHVLFKQYSPDTLVGYKVPPVLGSFTDAVLELTNWIEVTIQFYKELKRKTKVSISYIPQLWNEEAEYPAFKLQWSRY